MGFFRVVLWYILPAAVNAAAFWMFLADPEEFSKQHVLGRAPTEIESLLIHRGLMGFFGIDMLALMTGIFCKDHRFKVTVCLMRLVSCGLGWHVGPVSLLRLARASTGPEEHVKLGLVAVGATLFINVVALLFEMTNEPKAPGGSVDAFRALMAEASKVRVEKEGGSKPTAAGKSPGSASKGGKKK